MRLSNEAWHMLFDFVLKTQMLANFFRLMEEFKVGKALGNTIANYLHSKFLRATDANLSQIIRMNGAKLLEERFWAFKIPTMQVCKRLNPKLPDLLACTAVFQSAPALTPDTTPRIVCFDLTEPTAHLVFRREVFKLLLSPVFMIDFRPTVIIELPASDNDRHSGSINRLLLQYGAVLDLMRGIGGEGEKWQIPCCPDKDIWVWETGKRFVFPAQGTGEGWDKDIKHEYRLNTGDTTTHID